MTLRSRLLGVGHSLPARVVENSEFKNWIDTSDEWITKRSGIKNRHYVSEDELTSDVGNNNGPTGNVSRGQVEDYAIIVATCPDTTFPSVATIVQGALGMTTGFAFDVQAVCAGFAYALLLQIH